MMEINSSIPLQQPEEVEFVKIKKGLIANFFKYIEIQTGDRNFIRFFFERIIIILFSQIPTILGSMLRGIVYKLILGGIGSNCLIAKNVRFSTPRHVFVGSRVKIGEGCIIDARGFGSKIKIGNNVQVSRYTTIKCAKEDVVIGDNVVIGPFSVLEGWGGIEIGRDSLSAFHVVIITAMYTFEDRSRPINQQLTKMGKVIIGEDCWLGAHAIVLPGVNINKGAIVGAGGVVTKDIPEYSIVAGVPARIIRKRGEKKEGNVHPFGH